MWTYTILVLSITGCSICKVMKFPSTMKFGAATSAYQVEGAWNDHGKAPSSWDELVHVNPDHIMERATGDVACDSYHLWERDVEIAAEMGLDYYGFSLSWSRLFPSGWTMPNMEAVNYYNGLIDGLLAKGINPVVTLHYLDLPKIYNEQGGWNNPKMKYWFANYAREVFFLFANKVPTWITIAQPMVICNDVNERYDAIEVKHNGPSQSMFRCAKNVLMGHALAWSIYKTHFKQKYKGKVSISNTHVWFERSDVSSSRNAVEMARQLLIGLYTHPIFSKKGGWPDEVVNFIALKSQLEGLPNNRLPMFDEAELQLLRGSYDFYGMTYYTARLVRPARQNEPIGSWPMEGSAELGVIMSVKRNWHRSIAEWLFSYPKGLRLQLIWIKQKYGNVNVFITENGYPDDGKSLNDQDRIDYIREHLQQVMLAIHIDGVNVIAYTVWSLMDSFEWFRGYTQKYGLYAVDFESPERTRTPRASSRYYSAVIKERTFRVRYINSQEPMSSSDFWCTVAILCILLFINFRRRLIRRILI